MIYSMRCQNKWFTTAVYYLYTTKGETGACGRMWHTERQLHIVHTHVTADGPKNKFRPDVQFIKLGICVKPAATGEEFWLVTVTLIIYIGRIIMHGNFPVNIFVHMYTETYPWSAQPLLCIASLPQSISPGNSFRTGRALLIPNIEISPQWRCGKLSSASQLYW